MAVPLKQPPRYVTVPIVGPVPRNLRDCRDTSSPAGSHFKHSANAPWHVPNTSSPGLNCVTLRPTASTWPATSTPGPLGFGLHSPSSRRTMNGPPFINFQSSGLTAAAHSLISTSSLPGIGLSISPYIRIFGGTKTLINDGLQGSLLDLG